MIGVTGDKLNAASCKHEIALDSMGYFYFAITFCLFLECSNWTSHLQRFKGIPSAFYRFYRVHFDKYFLPFSDPDQTASSGLNFSPITRKGDPMLNEVIDPS